MKSSFSKALFITAEGTEGVGKSTGLKAVCEILEKSGIDYVRTREPGGTALGEALRELLLNKDEQYDISPDTELMLMFAARKQHLDTVIKPALSAGKFVVCDRFTDATFAYQGGGRGIDEEKIQQLADWVHPDCQPHITLLFDAPVEVGLQRAKKRGELDRFEQEAIDFFQRVREKYLSLAKQDTDRFILINAEHDIPQVVEQITAGMSRKLQLFLERQ